MTVPFARSGLLTFAALSVARAASAVLAVGCGSAPPAPLPPTPYQPFTNQGPINGGYIDRDLGNGMYVVTFRGNVSTLYEDVLSMAYDRAREVCPGGYETVSVQDVSAEVDNGTATANGIPGHYTIEEPTRYTMPRARVVVRCHTSAPGPSSAPSPQL
jgi:hypothetical protein